MLFLALFPTIVVKNLQEILAKLTILIRQRDNIDLRENHRHVRGSARMYDLRMAQFVPKIEELSYIMDARGF